MAQVFLGIPSCATISSLKQDLMVHPEKWYVQIKDCWCIINMWEAGQTQTVIARRLGITDTQQSGRLRLSSAADDRMLV